MSDESDRALLPATFEDLLGLPRETLKSHPTRSNRGLNWGETELVRSVNEVVTEAGWSRADRRRFVKQGVLRDMASRPAPDGPKNPPFPDWALAQLRELSDERVEQIQALDVRVVGDAESMRLPADVPVAPSPFEAPSVSGAVAAAAVTAVIRVALGPGAATPSTQPDEDEEA